VLLALFGGAGAWASDTSTADSLLKEGLSEAHAGQFEAAAQLFRRGSLLYPADQRFLLELAGVAYRRKDNRAAKAYLRRALRLASLDPYGNDFLATLYLLDGNLAAALQCWNRIDKPLIQDVVFAPMPALDPILRERAVEISGGQIFTLNRLYATEANLDRLDIFAHSQFELAPREDQRFDLTLRVSEVSQPFGRWLGRLLPIVRGLPYETVDFDRYNIGERAINLTSIVRWDSNKRRIGAELAAPWRLNPQLRYRLLFGARDERWDLAGTALSDLKMQRMEAGGDLIMGLNDRLTWTTGLRIARRRFENDDSNPVFRRGWTVTERNRIDYQLWRWPERRVHVDATGDLDAGRVLTGASSPFATVTGDLSGTWLPEAKGDRWTVSARLRSGKTWGSVPFDQFFMLGMERDNDLWFRGDSGDRDGRKGNAPLGTEYALAQIEIDRTLWEFPFVKIQAGPFFDFGQISGPSNQFGSHGWRPATGIEAKIATTGRVTWALVYGRDLRTGRGAFYSAATR
jgi:tetratricopeptide (TPR) repeat protein